jgi:hypothetical protein
MKVYLATTTILFGLLSALHLWRVFAERNVLVREPWHLASIGAIGVVAGALSIWACRLLIKRTQKG